MVKAVYSCAKKKDKVLVRYCFFNPYSSICFFTQLKMCQRPEITAFFGHI